MKQSVNTSTDKGDWGDKIKEMRDINKIQRGGGD